MPDLAPNNTPAPSDPPSRKVLLRQDTAEYLLHLELVEDGLFLLATAVPRKFGVPMREKLEEALASCGLVDKVNPDAVKNLCAITGEGKGVDKMVIAAGTPPEPGRDEYLEFFVKTSSTAELVEDEGGNIDFHNLNIFGNVEEGQLIGKLNPPGEGLPGMSITGVPIQAPTGRKLSFTIGEGARLDDDTIIAEKAGRVVYTEDTVSVTDELVIEGDVDFSVGNIVFKGVVTVKGDVLDEFSIIAEKGISVIGTAGACKLESNGNITLAGMAGQGKGTIRCKGNLVSHYLHEVDIKCEGSVVAGAEIMNSTIKCLGPLRAEKALISGGTITALGGVECRILGSRSGVRTKVIAGAHFGDLEELAALYEKLKDVSNRLDKAKTTEETTILCAEKMELQKQVLNIRVRRHEGANPKVNVLSKVLDNVCIAVGNATEVVAELAGAYSIIENIHEGGVGIFSHTPLEVPAINIINGLTNARRYAV